MNDAAGTEYASGFLRGPVPSPESCLSFAEAMNVTVREAAALLMSGRAIEVIEIRQRERADEELRSRAIDGTAAMRALLERERQRVPS